MITSNGNASVIPAMTSSSAGKSKPSMTITTPSAGTVMSTTTSGSGFKKVVTGEGKDIKILAPSSSTVLLGGENISVGVQTDSYGEATIIISS